MVDEFSADAERAGLSLTIINADGEEEINRRAVGAIVFKVRRK